jgi:hypothetical protein
MTADGSGDQQVVDMLNRLGRWPVAQHRSWVSSCDV